MNDDPPTLESAIDRIINISSSRIDAARRLRINYLAQWAKLHLPVDWQPIETAPKDGHMLCLLVDASIGIRDPNAVTNDPNLWTPTEDEILYPTIGSNSFDLNGIDEWSFAGWCWSQDHWIQGQGTPIWWKPYPDFTLQRKSFVPPTVGE